MRRATIGFAVAGVLLVLAATGMAGSIETAITNAGDALVSAQSTSGYWPGDTEYTGAIAAGLVNAWRVTSTTSYLTAAQSAGTFIQNNALGNYLGDEAYSFACLSQAAANPASNTWRTELNTFYGTTVPTGIGGTTGYITRLIDHYATNFGDYSQSEYYLAEHAVAANYVNASDKAVWRNSVISNLGKISDSDYYPVLSLGVAVWALAKTGPLDSTLVTPAAASGSRWYQVELGDLPAMLAGNIVASGTFAGSFYWRFDHFNDGGSGYASGYTEDTVFGTLGLIAADEQNPSLDYGDEILAARMALATGVSPAGDVADHIWLGNTVRFAYAGETLQALPEPTTVVLLGIGLMTLVRRRRQAQ